MKKKEIIIVISLMLIALLALALNKWQDQSNIVQVIHHVDGESEVIMEIDITKDNIYTIDVENGSMSIEVKDKAVRVFDVDCPNHLCEKMGWISKDSVNKMIVCIPNNITLEFKVANDE